MTDAEKFDALVMTVMRGTHREARDMARARFVEMRPEERGHAEKVAREADALVSMHDRLEASVARCASLEALVRELAKGVVAVRDLMAESGGVYDLHMNGDPSPWEELTEGGRFEGWLIDYSAAESALTHPLVSELTGEKEGGE